MSKAFCAPTSIIEDEVKLSEGVKVWNFSHIRSGAQIGSNTIIGDYVYIGQGVVVGSNCKIQNSNKPIDLIKYLNNLSDILSFCINIKFLKIINAINNNNI